VEVPVHRTTLTSGLIVLALGCAAGMTPPTGERTFGDPVSNAIKTIALKHALAELSRSTNNAGPRIGVYLDTMVGPTPEKYFYQYVHPRDWLDSVAEAKMVDGLIGPIAERRTVQRVGFSIAMGEPYPAGRDTVEIVYAWCVRSFPTQPWAASNGGIWRDALVRGDTGWARVSHSPAMAPVACVQ
jgi:hypothetical protein